MAKTSVDWARGLLSLPHLTVYQAIEASPDGMHGYELVQQLHASGFDVQQGWVYGVLMSGARNGRFELARSERSRSGPERKLYVVTDEGRRAMSVGQDLARAWIDAAELAG